MIKTLQRWSCAVWLACSDVLAEESASTALKQSAHAVSHTDILQWLLALLIVIAIFFGLVWLLRKSGNLASTGKGQLVVLAGLSLGMRERLVLVKVGEKQLLLGVTPGRIDKLLELEGGQRLFLDQENSDDNGLFARKLQQLMQGNNRG